MSPAISTEHRQWMAQWRTAAIALERIRIQEIRVLDLARVAADLDDACLASVQTAGPQPTSGLIAQQRILHTTRGT